MVALAVAVSIGLVVSLAVAQTTPPDTEPVTTTTTESGCTMSPDPGKPQPWKALFVVVGLVAAAAMRRRPRA